MLKFSSLLLSFYFLVGVGYGGGGVVVVKYGEKYISSPQSE